MTTNQPRPATKQAKTQPTCLLSTVCVGLCVELIVEHEEKQLKGKKRKELSKLQVAQRQI